MFADIEQLKAQIAKGDRDGALRKLAELLRANPESADLWYLVAVASSDPDKRIKAARKALHIDPAHMQAAQLYKELRGDLSQPSPFTPPTYVPAPSRPPVAVASSQSFAAPRSSNLLSIFLIAAVALVILLALLNLWQWRQNSITQEGQQAIIAALESTIAGAESMATVNSPAPTSAPSTSIPTPAAFTDMFIKNGVQIRYPQNWEFEVAHTNITFTPKVDEGEVVSETFLVTSYRDQPADISLAANEVCGNEVLAQQGYSDSDGKVILKPGGEFIAAHSTTINGMDTIVCGYRSENTILMEAYYKANPTNRFVLTGISNNAAAFEPLFDQIAQSLQVDIPQMGDWGRLTTNTLANPVPFGQPGYVSYLSDDGYKITFDQVLRGKAAEDRLEYREYLDYPIMPGNEMLLLHVAVEAITTNDHITILDLDYKIVAHGKMLEGENNVFSMKDGEMLNLQLYEGQKGDGWILRQVPKNDPAPLIAYDEFNDPVYFALQ